MAIKFADSKGAAQKSSILQYTYVEGDNSVRMVGDILPRYVYCTIDDFWAVPFKLANSIAILFLLVASQIGNEFFHLLY